ncbi:transporter substrate-binding domain-containing protein [Pseudodesulfovibrio sp. zrk46]|uniref:PAS domain S-box protein n=1 Tax=Pseudodesulfovibrio sp. zrk46 TaxID=2725288 RepID=UPI001449E766|nr:transporter substrate-binding domain-containing protein [Pseudodesulfovibrio sp. zrk46]QJB55641.1 PAS domain S-box protein [Pseudodesulfovibrio sp. zrk46]
MNVVFRRVAVAAILFVLCLVPFGVHGQELANGTIIMNEEEKAWLAAHPDIRLGMWLASPPTMFRGKKGEMEGFIPAYLKLISQRLNIKPRRVRASSFAAAWELAKALEVDMLPAVTAEKERGNDMLFSKPYLVLPIVVVTRSDFPFISGLEDLNGQVVAMAAEHVPHLRIPEDYPEIVPMPVQNPEQGLLAVSRGLADAFVASQFTASYLARERNLTNVRIAAVTEYSYRLSVAVRKDWPELLVLVNRALDSITEEERQEIHDYWTVLQHGNWMEKLHVWQLLGGVGTVAVALLGAFFFWNRRLANEVMRRKKAERVTRKANEATQLIIESASVVVVGLDFVGRVLLFNQAGEQVTEYDRTEVMDTNWFDVVVPRERYPFAWEKFNRIIQGGEAEDSIEHPLVTKSGEERRILWRYSVTEDDPSGLAVIAFGTDITSRLEAEEELRLTQFAMDNAAVGVFRILPSGAIVYANRAAAEMVGYSRSRLLTMSIPEVAPSYTRENWPEFWDRLKESKMLTFERDIEHRDGSVLPVEVTTYYLQFKGAELSVGFLADISERRRVERLREDVERMVRHDLRSPTLAVQTLFKLFGRADNLTEDQKELLASVRDSSQRMIHIIDMSRAIFRMESGKYELHPQPVDLVKLVLSILDELRPLLRAQDVEVGVNVDGTPASDEMAFMISSEEILCYTLLVNLIKNAVEACPLNGVVTVNFMSAKETTITVHNPGVIPEDIRDNFFEKYVTAGKVHGTGLGTYTARLVTLTLGGRIDFISSQKGGTVLTVSLPVESKTNS